MIDFLSANWLWIVIAAVFVWMHTRPGGCGMHTGHGDHAPTDTTNETTQHPDRHHVA